MLGLCCCTGFSLVVASRGHSLLRWAGLSLLRNTQALEHGFWALEHRFNSCGQGFSCSAACGIFQISVSRIVRWILSLWAIGEALTSPWFHLQQAAATNKASLSFIRVRTSVSLLGGCNSTHNRHKKKKKKKQKTTRASLVVQWLKILLAMQETLVWSLVWEYPTGCGAAHTVHHSYGT